MKPSRLIHTLTLLFFVCSLTSVLPGTALAAKAKKIQLTFDIVTKDLECLKEPKGIIHLNFKIPKEAAKYETQLRDAVDEYFQKQKQKIHAYMEESCKALKKNPDQHAKLAKNLNKLYKDLIKETKKGMVKVLDEEWKEMKKRKKDLQIARITDRLGGVVKTGKGLFTMITAGVRIGVTEGADVAAYFTMVSGTATTAKGFYETIKGPTYDNLGDLDMKIDQATGTLKRIAAGRKSTTAKHVKKAKKELDPVTKSYSKSLAKAEVKHGNLVKKINKLLDATEKLKKKKLKKATRKKIAKAEKKINAVIAATADLGEVLRDGKRSYKDARALSKKLTETEKAMGKSKAKELLSKIIDPDNLDKLATFTNKLADKWPDIEEKAKTLYNTLSDVAKMFG